MPNWIRIAAVDDCPPGEARELLVEDRVIALFQVDGRFYACWTAFARTKADRWAGARFAAGS